MGIVIAIFCLILLCFFFILNKEKEKNEEWQEEYEQLRNKRFEEVKQVYDQLFIEELKVREEEINRLKGNLNEVKNEIYQKNQEKKQIENSIIEKQNFNNSLFKIREDELDRLIDEKKKEKEAALYALIEKERQEAYERVNQEENNLRAKYNFNLHEFYLKEEEKTEQFLKEIAEIQEELNQFSEKRIAINAAILREKELEEKEDFYRIVVPIEDQEDIEVLNTIAPRLQNKEALNKLVYESFIRHPLDEMIKRVLGGREPSGIYKITYIKTGEAYIGKSTNLKKRWVEHVKSAFDIGSIASSSFHTRLKKDGVWNYTFEILEEVSKEQLTEREKYYIQLYGTDTQLNMKVG